MITVCWFLFILIHSSQGSGGEKITVVRELENCTVSDRLPAKIYEKKIDNAGRGRTALSFIIGLDKVVESFSKVVITVTKCRSRSEPASCEFFMKLPLNKGCELASMKNQIWSPIFESSERPLTCPLSGQYKVVNMILDAGPFVNFMPGVEGPYWKLKIDAYNKKEHLLCITVGAEIMTLKRKKLRP